MPVSNLILTVIGRDRVGLVESIAKTISAHGASWEASHMSSLGGQFAGILRVEVPKENFAALKKELESLGPSGLTVQASEDSEKVDRNGEESYWVELVGSNQPNIVRNISKVLARHNVTVLELASESCAAPVCGGSLFKMQISWIIIEAVH